MILTTKQLDVFLKRRRMTLDRAEAVARPIVEDVRRRGDRAVAEYSRKFDKPSEAGALSQKALEVAARNIERFARLQMPKSWMKNVAPGIRAGQTIVPLESVGCYAPGGMHPLVSTVLMTVIPARVAGVEHIAVASPCASEMIRSAARLAGASAVYPIGGVHAIAAMAYGTQTIRRVDRIVGPGGIYVTAAKKIIAAECGIDFIAGPTEIVLIAARGNAQWIAADMLAQAEHDPAAVAILLTPSRALAERVAQAFRPAFRTSAGLRQKACATVVTRSIDEALEISNRIAPEHLWIDDARHLRAVRNAGSIFIGPHSPVAAGDYATGPNHTLPTSGAARLRGGLSVYDFLKIVTVQQLTPQGLSRIAPAVTALARAEGLEYHARSIEVRG